MKITEQTSLLEMGCIVCDALKAAGIGSFLSGGAVVTIYSENRYLSYDLDFISHGDFKKISGVMEGLGFTRERGRHFIHPKSQFFVEFPGTATAIGDEPIREFGEITTPAGTLKLLTPTHCVMDRLAAFYHWNDHQSLEQAVAVATRQPIQLEKIRDWSSRERMSDKFQSFLNRLKTAQGQST